MGRVIEIPEEKLRKIIRETLEEFFDPDYGMSIRKEFVELLKKSKEEEEKGDIISLDEIKKKNSILSEYMK